jgi:uncharacterized membrane protein YozB (DUF420 family)
MTTVAMRVADTSVRRHDRLFYASMSLASIVAVFVGFAPTYYLKSYFRAAPLTPLVHLHGLVFTGWILLFLTQTVLVARHRTDLHRRLGVAGAGLAVLLVVIGVTTATVSARRGFAGGSLEALTFLATPFGDRWCFLILAAAGLLYRRRPEAHKRLMLLATLSILDAAVARWPLAIIRTVPIAFFVITDVFMLAGPIYDLASRRRVHPAYIWGVLLVLISQPVRLLVARTDAWHSFASALVR